MNTYTKFFLALCCSGTIVSCSNDLDEKVYSKITEQTYNYTVDDFSPSIASVYSQLRSFPSHGGYFTTQEVSADAIVMPPNASGWDDGGVYRRMHYQTWNSEQGHVSEIWSNFYQGALLCNKVIEQGGNFYGRMNKWAAKTLLANIYLNAKVYTGEEHWDDCIQQCDDIINSNRFALSDNYKDPFRSTGVETSKEVIFTIPFDANIAGGNSIHMFSWHGELKKKYETEATPWGCGSAMGVTQFIDTYDPEDSRLADSWLMGEQRAADGSPLYGTYDKMGEPLVYTKDLPDGNYTSEMEGFRMNKFEIVKGEQSSSETDVPLFRYAEVLLMKAECLLRSGKPGAGLLVTEVRKRAFKDNPELAIVTDAQLQENSSYQYGYVEHYTVTDKGNTDLIRFGRMYDELGWEFAWEMHRRRDAIRFGVYTKKSWLSHKPQGDYRSVFPIPEKVLTSNPNLEQNPHYK